MQPESNALAVPTRAGAKVGFRPGRANLLRCLRGRASERPDGVAFVYQIDDPSKRTAMTYAQLDRRARAIAACLQDRDLAGQRVTFYEREGFAGQSFTTETQVGNFVHSGYNDRASSVVVLGDRFEVCEDARFSGRCVVLRPGRYPSLTAMGLNNRISSVRAVSRDDRIDDDRYAPAPVPVYDSRRRGNERLYQANVTSVRAVVGTPEQRCWVEREQVAQERGGANVPGAIIGALIGGVLGHQVGGGRGQDIATVGGGVVGGVVGANVGRDGGGQVSRDVQRCENVPSTVRPDYWDVTYEFRGQQHRMQMTSPLD